MSPASSTSPSTIAGTSPDQPQPSRVEKKKRNRIPLSCHPCRVRKLKCDRQIPCENCLKRNDSDNCIYAFNGARRRKALSSTATGSSPDEMQQRIDRLEGLVLSLMQGKDQLLSSVSGSRGEIISMSSTGQTATSLVERSQIASSQGQATDNAEVDEDEEFEEEDEVMVTEEPLPVSREGYAAEKDDRCNFAGDDRMEVVRKALGVMEVSKGVSYFRGETHINTILKEISEIKAFYQNTKIRPMFGYDQGEMFPFAAGVRLTKEELLTRIPPRSIVDEVVNNFFTWLGPLFHVLHKPTFFREYEEFWMDPTTVDPIWLALLFVMMHLSWNLFSFSGNGPEEYQPQSSELVKQYIHLAEAALVAGEFTKRGRYHYNTVRTLYLICAGRSFQDTSDDSWLLLGLIIRIAMSMGLHRDGEQYRLSYYETEIRRRLWTGLACIDLVHSIKIGLPSMVRDGDFDTKPPSNINDEEIWEDMTEPPIPHHPHDQTDISYLIFKAALVRTYGKIVVCANAIGERPPYEEIMKLDAELREQFSHLPPYLRLPRTMQMQDDPGWLILQRIMVEIMYHKAIITLHRPFASKAWRDPKYHYSRKELVNACISMIDNEFGMVALEDDRLRHVRWFALGLVSYDFMHAAISLCVDLWDSLKAEDFETAYTKGGDVDPKRTIGVLERTKAYCNPDAHGSSERFDHAKTYGIISLVLGKVYGLYNAKKNAENSPMAVNGSGPSQSHTLSSAFSSGQAEPSNASETPQSEIIYDSIQSLNPTAPVDVGWDAGNFSIGLRNTKDTYPNAITSSQLSVQSSNGYSSYPSTSDYSASQAPVIQNWEEWDDFMQGINLDPVVPNSEWWQSIPLPPMQHQWPGQ